MSERWERPAAATASERAELDWLRRVNALLRVENDMLRRIATEYALDRGDAALGGWQDEVGDRQRG